MINRDESSASDIKTGSNLPRVLGFRDIVGIVIGGVIGSGIFIVPAVIAARLQAPILIAGVWLVGGLLSFFGALSFSELGAAYPQAGGAYIYLREAYGPLLAFLFGWTLFLVIDTGAVAALAVAFSTTYLQHFIRLTPLASKLISAGILIGLVIFNIIGLRAGAFFQNALTVVKYAALVGICGVVFVLARGGEIANLYLPLPGRFSPALLGKFGGALVATLWAYKGWESASYSAGETKRPGKNLPLGLFAGVLLCVLIYILVNLSYLYVVPAASMAYSTKIASDVMNLVVGPAGASIIALIILFSIVGAANPNFMTSPRVYFAMARDGLFFPQAARVHPKFRTPHVSIAIMGVWSIILSLSGSFEQLFSFAIFGAWIFFGLTVGAVIILRKKRPDLPRPYRTWGYPVTPLLFVLASLFISLSSLLNEFWNSFWGVLIILLGVPVYFFWRRKSKRTRAREGNP